VNADTRIAEMAIETLAVRVLELEDEREAYRAVTIAALDALHDLNVRHERLTERLVQVQEWNRTLVAMAGIASQQRTAA
jgi:hypothetical protein